MVLYTRLALAMATTTITAVRAFTPTFSEPRQCAPLSITYPTSELFSLLPPGASTVSITFVPFDNPAHPPPPAFTFEMPCHDLSSSESTSFTVPSLPFPAGTQFFASMHAPGGVLRKRISDILTVSASKDTSCVAQAPTPEGRRRIKHLDKRQAVKPPVIELGDPVFIPVDQADSPSLPNTETPTNAGTTPSSPQPPIKEIGFSVIDAQTGERVEERPDGTPQNENPESPTDDSEDDSRDQPSSDEEEEEGDKFVDDTEDADKTDDYNQLNPDQYYEDHPDYDPEHDEIAPWDDKDYVDDTQDAHHPDRYSDHSPDRSYEEHEDYKPDHDEIPSWHDEDYVDDSADADRHELYPDHSPDRYYDEHEDYKQDHDKPSSWHEEGYYVDDSADADRHDLYPDHSPDRYYEEYEDYKQDHDEPSSWHEEGYYVDDSADADRHDLYPDHSPDRYYEEHEDYKQDHDEPSSWHEEDYYVDDSADADRHDLYPDHSPDRYYEEHEDYKSDREENPSWNDEEYSSHEDSEYSDREEWSKENSGHSDDESDEATSSPVDKTVKKYDSFEEMVQASNSVFKAWNPYRAEVSI